MINLNFYFFNLIILYSINFKSFVLNFISLSSINLNLIIKYFLSMYVMFIKRLKKAIKIFDPRTWCTKKPFGHQVAHHLDTF